MTGSPIAVLRLGRGNAQFKRLRLAAGLVNFENVGSILNDLLWFSGNSEGSNELGGVV